MSHTRVVHCKRQPHDVYIGRPSVWGNPFEIGKDGTREEVIALYREHIEFNTELYERAQLELRGKVLGCWCHPQACHGDVLAEIANRPLEKPLLHVSAHTARAVEASGIRI